MPPYTQSNFRQLNQSNVAALQYATAIASAYRRFSFLVDPDFATQNEPEAWQKIRRDADIAHAIMKRRQAVAGLSWHHEPVEDDDADKMAAQLMDFLIGHVRRFHFARYNLAEAIFRGSSWAFMEGERQPVQVPGDRFRSWWTPRNLRHVDRFRFRLIRTDDGKGPITTRWQFFSIQTHLWHDMAEKDLRFFIRHDFEQSEDTLGYGRGLLNSIYYFWRAKEIVLSQALNGIERFSNGIVTAKINGLRAGSTERNNDDLVDEWIEELNKQRTQHVLVHDKEDEIQIHDWPATGASMLWETYDRLQQGIDRLILTSQLPTGGGSDVGSLARGKVEAEEMEATFQSDRQALAETLDGSLSLCTWRRNIGIIREFFAERGLPMPNRPRFKISQRKIDDPASNADILIKARQAGIPVLLKEAYEKLGLTQPRPEDEIIVPGQPQTGSPFEPGQRELPFSSPVMRMRDYMAGSPSGVSRYIDMDREARDEVLRERRIERQEMAMERRMIMAALMKEAPTQPPSMTFQLPKEVNVPAPIVNVHVPEQPAPVVNVAAPEVTVKSPDVIVNVPDQKPPDVIVRPIIHVPPVTVPPISVPASKVDVEVKLPEPKQVKGIEIARDADGKLKARIIRDKGE